MAVPFLRIGGALVALALASAAAASCANGASVTGLDCTSTQTICDTVCADLKGDTENCGKCGNQCASAQLCVNGVCELQCPSGDTVCGGDAGKGRCVNTKSDNANCGGCGHACPTGQICYQGICNGTCGDPKLGQSVCTSEAGAPYCANTKSDNQNCGKCGTTCGAEQVCSSGVCQGDCSPDQTMCGGEGGPVYCANTQSDNANCGACGAPCGVLQGCSGGQCVSQCDENQTMCNTDGGLPFCADTYTDNTNCGSCGNVCPSNKPLCAGGNCTSGTCNLTALVLGDGVAASNSAYQTLLQGVGFAVTLQSSGTTTYTGSPSAAGFGVVIVTPGATYTTDMPTAGQSSIVSGQGSGTGVIFTEWAAYEVTTSHYLTLASLLLFPRTSGFSGTLTFTLTSSGHPIWNGLPSTFTTSLSLGTNTTSILNAGAVQIASCSQCGGIGVAAKDPSAGRIVQIAHAAAYTSNWYSDTNLTKMMANAALWAARCN